MGKYTHEDFEIGETYLITTSKDNEYKFKVVETSEIDSGWVFNDEVAFEIKNIKDVMLYKEDEEYSDQEKLIIQKCEEVKDLLIRKNRDYGNSAQKSYEKWGSMSFMIRIEDKISRLENLIKNNGKHEVKDESLYDSALDAGGYFLLWLVELEKRKEKNE